MRVSMIVVLAVATILVSPAVVQSHMSKGSLSKTSANLPDVFTTDKNERKLLRSNLEVNIVEGDSGDYTNAEERALPGTSKVVELASKFSISQKLSNMLLLKASKTPKNVFKMLNIGKAGEKLHENPKILQWFRYVTSYRNEGHSFYDYEVYFMLVEKLPEAKVATLLQSLKRVPDIDPLATKVELAQFGRWFDRKLKPDDVATKVFGLKSGLSTVLPSTDPRFSILTDYTIAFARQAQRERRFYGQ